MDAQHAVDAERPGAMAASKKADDRTAYRAVRLSDAGAC